MKILITILLLSCSLTPARAAADCAKNADACTASTRANSPFLTAAAADPATDKRSTATNKAPAAAKPGTPAAVEVSSTSAGVPLMPASSSPLWLVFIGVSLAGLYFYLGSAGKRRKK